MLDIQNLMNNKLIYLNEPKLIFGYNQKTIDPRDGLTLFGPYESLAPFSVKAGVVATSNGFEAYKYFVERVNKPIISTKKVYGKIKIDEISRPSFPGFEAIFNISWPTTPEIYKELDSSKLNTLLKEKKKKKRILKVVDYYLQKILEATKKEDTQVNIWFIIVPRNLYSRCRPGSWGSEVSREVRQFLDLTRAGQQLFNFLLEDEEFQDDLKNEYDSREDFHHVLKARLIQEKITIPVQLIVESTLYFRDKKYNKELDENIKAHLAWTQSTTLYYKLGKLPWKLGDIRDGVCYLGLVFKKLKTPAQKGNVCSAAQMFLKDGDGSVFRGNIGAWESKSLKEFHLDEKASCELLTLALDDYFEKWNKYPNELFIHGRAKFSEEEWTGFKKAIEGKKAATELTGVVIKESSNFKIFRDIEHESSNYGVLRGLAFQISDREAYLMTRGFIPRLNTSSSIEVPNSLHIQITRGTSDMGKVLNDVLALTKLNYNACIFGDGVPVTLRFSDLIGNILTATENWKVDIRQFRFYI